MTPALPRSVLGRLTYSGVLVELRTASHQQVSQLGETPIDSVHNSLDAADATARVFLRNMIAAVCAGRRRGVEPLLTYGFAFDRARGLTAELRYVIGWIAERGHWITRHTDKIWRANPRGAGWTKEGVREEVVYELERLGFLQLLLPTGHRMTAGGDPGHAKLLQVV